MKSEAECEQCRRLLDDASSAITRQLRAIARLEMARLRHENDLIPSLEAVVREAELTRVEAVAAYRKHRGEHAGAAAAQGG